MIPEELKWFQFDHLDERLHEVVRPFAEVAQQVYDRHSNSTIQRNLALSLLVQAKDAAVRAVI